MGNYKKCDCCGKLVNEEELEEVTITIKKCKDCDISDAPILNNGGFTEKPLEERPAIKSMNSYKNMPPILNGVSMTPPSE
jgi:hypothetical protein